MLRTDKESTVSSTIRGLIYELRPHQWYKQAILFIPLIYSGQAASLDAWIQITVGAITFSFVVGCVYIVNDILDREEDRKHPMKRHRPIASGQVSVGIAWMSAIVGFLITGAVAFRLDFPFGLVIVAYVVQNAAYSTVLKHLFLVDILIIGSGFVLRALGGVTLIDATLSPWLFLTVFLTALLLASGKRHAAHTADRPEQRSSIDEFTGDFSFFLLFLAAATLLVVYSLYTFFARRTEMMLTIPFAYYAVCRLSHLTITDPTERIHENIFRRDMVANFVLWGIATLIILYVLPNT